MFGVLGSTSIASGGDPRERLYAVIYAATKTPPANNPTGKAQIRNGLDGDGDPATWFGYVIPGATTGVFDWPEDATGLLSGTGYKVSLLLSDGNIESNVDTSATHATHTDAVVTGVAAAVSVGSVTATGGATATVVGVAAPVSVGAVEADTTEPGGATATVVGVGAAASVGIVSVNAGATAAVAGVAAAAAVGAVAAQGGASAAVAGVAAAVSVGAVTVAAGTGVTASIVGVSADAQVGQITVTGGASALVPGVAAATSVGQVGAGGVVVAAFTFESRSRQAELISPPRARSVSSPRIYT